MFKRMLVAALAAALPFAASASLARASTLSSEEAQAQAPALASSILREISNANPSCNRESALSAITRATNGADLRVIVAALQLLRRSQVSVFAGPDPSAQARARDILACQDVQQALAEAGDVANLALNSSQATGGVPTGGTPGQAFGSSGVGAPGGGGGSGYVVIQSP